MIQILKRTAVLFMTATILFCFTSCFYGFDKNDARDIEKLLEQKYGIEFEVTSIGNRLTNPSSNTVTAYCHPKNNDKVIFEAVMSTNKELVSDDYRKCLLETEAKDIIEERFSKNGIEATVDVSISRLIISDDLSDKNLAQVITDCPTISLTFTTVISDKADLNSTYEVTKEILYEFYSGNTEMLLGTSIWRYDEKAYKQCTSEMNNIPTIAKTALEDYNPISNVNLAIRNGKINKNLEEFSKEFN